MPPWILYHYYCRTLIKVSVIDGFLAVLVNPSRWQQKERSAEFQEITLTSREGDV
jgi:hypothetical protein